MEAHGAPDKPVTIKLAITLDQAMNGLYYAFLAWLFIEPLGIGLYVFGLCLLPLLALWAAHEAWSRWQRKRTRASERAWMNGGYDAATDMERRMAHGEIYYPEF